MKIILSTTLIAVLLKTTFVALPISAKLGDTRHLEAPQKKKKPATPKKKTAKKKTWHMPIPNTKVDKKEPTVSNQDDPDERIVGGQQVAGPGVYPFYVSWDGSCGGSRKFLLQRYHFGKFFFVIHIFIDIKLFSFLFFSHPSRHRANSGTLQWDSF